MTMQYIKDPCRQIEELQNTIRELEQEIQIKDEAHCQELRLMQKHIEALMNKYCLN